MRILLSSSLSLWWAVMAPAQTVPLPLPIPASLNQTQGSGMIGVAINQTARLNVLNSAAPPPADSPIATPACKVTLQVFDDQNTKLGELAVDNLAPGTAAHVDYPRPVANSSSTPLRVQVRGLVTIAVTLGTGMGTVITPTLVVPTSACSLVSTLEVFDSDTGKTQIVLPAAASIASSIIPVITFTP